MLISACFFSASVNGKCSGPVLWGQPAYRRRDHLLLDASLMSTAARPKENFIADCNEHASTIQSANLITAYPSPSRCTVEEALVVAHSFIIIGIQPLGRFGQRPELSQSTGIPLVRCILGRFLGVVCHCFPPGFFLRRIKCNLDHKYSCLGV